MELVLTLVVGILAAIVANFVYSSFGKYLKKKGTKLEVRFNHGKQSKVITINDGASGSDVVQQVKAAAVSKSGTSSGVSGGSRVTVAGSNNMSGNIAGGNLVIQQDKLQDHADELVGILEDRAKDIVKNLQLEYEVDVKQYLNDFLLLHREHVDALKKGHLVRAHEILKKINNLSYSLEKSESSKIIQINYQKIISSIDLDEHSTGALICGYIAGDCQRDSNRYSDKKRLLYEMSYKDSETVMNSEMQEERYYKLFL